MQKKPFEILSPHQMWKADYSKPEKCGTIRIFEYDTPLPPPPPKKSILGYGRKIENQKFEREKIPTDIHRWDDKKLDKFVAMMFHYRQHGKWMYIKGEPRYINGWAWFYYNFWTTEKGGRPDFRWEGVEFYTFFDHCWRDPNCYGMLDIKGRRMGDTDKSVCLMYDIASRYRNSWSGHQNIDKDAAKENYLRVLAGHQNMPFWLKPMMKGSSDPQKVMVFDYPEDYVSKKSEAEKKKRKALGEEILDIPAYSPLKSRVDYETSVLGKYDGKRLSFYYLDEPGKILAFDPNKQWNIVKPALAFYNGKKIVGFGMFTTTVEAFSDGKTLRNMKNMWDNSDPTELNENGRTNTGLYRIFRNATYTSEPDEWGFPKVEEAIEFINNTIKGYEAKSAWDDLLNFKRKHPLTIEDVFTPPHDECTLFPILLDKRLKEIQENICCDTGNDTDLNGIRVQPKAVRGNLIWKNGKKGNPVIWQPSPTGRWYISQHPTRPNHHQIRNGRKFPGNDKEYTFGVDPVDHTADAKILEQNKNTDVKKASFAAATVYRRFNPLVDGGLLLDDTGMIRNQSLMKTDKFVLDYQHRHQNPYDFYDDMLKTALYFGVKMHCERNKPGCINYFEREGFGGYILRKPRSMGKKKNAPNEKGTTATTPVIQMYVDLLQYHVSQRINTYDHPRLLQCYRLFNTLNRTERDLTVSAGYSLLADMDNKKVIIQEANNKFNESIYEMIAR